MISIPENKENIDSLKKRLGNSKHFFSVITNTRVIFKGNKDVLYDYFKSSNFSYSSLLLSNDSVIHWQTNKLLIKIKQGVAIENLLQTYQIPFSNCKQLGSDQNVFLVTLNDVEDKSIAYSNLLYESGNVIFAQPDFGMFLKRNNACYSNQWGLQNTGQYNGNIGTDINVTSAWNITDGNNVKIAVIDEGVDLTHPDLTNNLLSGFDATDGALGGTNGGCKGDDAHGTCCSGIIAAEDNSIGIKGVSYNANIIPIRIAYVGYYSNWITEVSWIINGIYQAWYIYKADVLSNSWGGSYNDAIANEIRNACIYGRNNKGCVVVAASGNNNANSVSFPALLDSVIAVGAISPCGERKNPNSCDGETTWGSNYGSELDVVAPGVLIPTTDIQGNKGYNPNLPIHTLNGGSAVSSDYQNQDYTIWFNGTSAACPHVSGVAALVLSVNPNLTGQQVRDILESTAQKVGGYNYQSNQNHPNGTWNDEMGYGLVDAYAAVQKAMPDLLIRDTLSDNGTEPSTVYHAYNSPDIWTTDLDSHVCNPTGGEDCYVCVRVHNNSDYPSSGNEKLIVNWAKAGVGLYWNYSWTGNSCFSNQMPRGGFVTSTDGITIPSIPAGRDTVLYILWHTPDPEDYSGCTEFLAETELWHFCLAARVHDGTPIAGENDMFTKMRDFTRSNNDVAWKNISIISDSYYSAIVNVCNPYSISKNHTLDIAEFTNANNPSVTNYAEVYITLDAGLLAAINSNANIIGLDWVSSNTLRWNGGSASIPVTLPANSDYTLKTTVHFLADQIPASNNFDFDIVLRNAAGDTVLGGEHYRCVRTNGRYFQAVAHDNMTILWGETATLYADDILETAEYKWYDDQGNEVGSGLTCNVNPLQNTTYTLRVTADADGYRAYSTVTVMVVDGELRLIAPNPADNQVRIGYALSRNVSAATLQILNGSGQVVYSQALSGGNGSKVTGEAVVNTSSLAAGTYTVRLVSSNSKVHDSKTLVVR